MSVTEVLDREQTQTLGFEPDPTAAPLARVDPARAEEPARRTQVMPAAAAGATAPQTLTIMAHSPDIGELFGALAAAQGEWGDVERTLTAKIESRRTSTAYEYEYESLADVLGATLPGMSKNGLALMQFPFTRAASVVLRTMLGHKSGQWIYNELTASIVDTSPQSVGSAITFLRRYAAKSILGIAAGQDDDGRAASTPAAGAPQPAQRRSERAAVQEAGATGTTQRAAAQRAAAAEKPPAPGATVGAHVGVIVDVLERNGGAVLKLSTGFQSATKVTEMVTAAKTLRDQKRTVELVTRPSSDPAKYAAVLLEINPQDREVGAEG